MTRLLLVAATIGVVSAFCLSMKFTAGVAWGASENDTTHPHLSLDAATFDFGKIDEGTVVTHTFKISNTGKSLLKLDEPTATCGCTIPRLARRKLKPDESTELSI